MRIVSNKIFILIRGFMIKVRFLKIEISVLI